METIWIVVVSLPDDDARALEAVVLLLAYGTDSRLKSNEGMTAADYARKRGLYETAEFLDSMALTDVTSTPNDPRDSSGPTLSKLTSLEEISFYGCPGVTNAGVAALARLPRLRQVKVSGPQITTECAAAFPALVQVEIGI